ncbi:MAG TPA: beta-ketoacyl synthase N-terminal-like domain-containing protein [Terriglobales bacterium]|nr:beta-ketoacyl synthase N-terminal-like domain-containing protein [Terriglobales bacterium]
MTQPVAVTGLGVVSPLGTGHQTFWRRLIAGETGIAPLAEAQPGALPQLAARVSDPTLRKRITSSLGRRMDELSRRFVAAARIALEDAAIDTAKLPPEALGIVAGSVAGNIAGTVEYLQRLFTKGPALASPMLFPNLVLNAPASYAAMELGCIGTNLTVSQLEVSAEQAIALGCDVIRQGRAEVVLAGGGDELTDVGTSVYRSTRALAGQAGGRQWSSPYDCNRSGVVLGEGAALLVLESVERARARGARCYAEIVSEVSTGVPAAPFTWPKELGSAPSRLRQWLDRNDNAIDLVAGSASSSRHLDPFELELLSAIFAGTAHRPSVTSIKGAVGEFGSAGGLNAAAACLALHHAMVPPLCHLEQPMPGHDFRFAASRGESQPLQRVLTLAIARGGTVAALLLQKASC